MSQSEFAQKAQEALQAARVLLEKRFFNGAANRAYYAAFHAARTALIAEGLSAADRAWSHEALPGALAQLIHRKKVYPAHLLNDLRTLLEVRLVADYRSHQVSSKEAARVVKTAERFVERIEQEIQQ